MDTSSRFVLLAKRILREFVVLGRVISAGFSGVQKQVETVAKEQQAKNEYEKTRPVMRAILKVPDAEKAQNERTKTEKKWLNRWKTLIETGTLIAVVAYVCVNHRQLSEMKKAADAAKQGADAAKSAADTAAHELELSERPWLSVSFMAVGPLIIDNNGAELAIKTIVTNVGHSPAIRGMKRLKLYTSFLLTPEPWKVRDELCGEVERISAQPLNKRLTQTFFLGDQSPEIVRYRISGGEIKKGMVSRDQFPGLVPLPPTYSFNIAYCVSYYSPFGSTQYHTGYAMDIMRVKPSAPYWTSFTLQSEVAPVSIIYNPLLAFGADAN